MPSPYEASTAVTRISGPFVSIMIAMAGSTACTVRTMCSAPSTVTWAELMRTTSIPASCNCRTNASVQRRSDNVATIFVFFISYILFPSGTPAPDRFGLPYCKSEARMPAASSARRRSASNPSS